MHPLRIPTSISISKRGPAPFHPSFTELGVGDSAPFLDLVLLITLRHILKTMWGSEFLFKS